jgi:two-component sensor histidine kinase
VTLEELYRLLRIGHVQAQGIVDTIEQPLAILDDGLCVVYANPSFFRSFRVEPDDTVGASLFRLGNGQWDIPALRRLLLDVIPHATAVEGYEVAHDFQTIGPKTFLVHARRMIHPDKHAARILVTFEDVTERRRSDASKDLLISEGDHRVRNLLTVVNTVLMRTRAAGRTAEEYREVLLGRLHALLESKALPIGDGEPVALDDVVRRHLAPFADHARIGPGPAVLLPPGKAAPLSLVLHELAVNAAKYGALSAAGGAVHVTWTVGDEGAGRALRLSWREEGGPPAEPGTRAGFGGQLIDHSVRDELGGTSAIEHRPEGLRVSLRIPL